MNQSIEIKTNVDSQSNAITKYTWILTILYSFLFCFGFYVTFIIHDGNLTSSIIGGIGIILSFVIRWISKRGYQAASGWAIVIMIPVSMFLNCFFDPGNSYIIGPTIGLIGVVTASSVLDSKSASLGLVVAIIGGCLVAISDGITLPTEEFSVEFSITGGICLGIIFIFLIYIFRRFMNLRLGVKVQLLVYITSLSLGEVLVQLMHSILLSGIQEGGILVQDQVALGNIFKSMVYTIAGFNAGFSIIALVFSRLIIRPLEIIVENLNAIATSGDSNRKIEINYQDEFGILGKASNALVEYLKEKTRSAQAIADNDLTQQVNVISKDDVLGLAFERMVSSLIKVTSGVVDNVHNLKKVSGDVLTAAEQSTLATQQIAETISQVATGINQQSESHNQAALFVNQLVQTIENVTRGANAQSTMVDQAANAAGQLSVVIDEVSQTAQDQAKEAAGTVSITRTSLSTVEVTLEGMHRIQGRVDQSTEKVKQMGEYSIRIGAILEVIEDIASQTNMLALNAAIEAARAGEAGKGFAVVADEVRKLAERSAQSTHSISEIVRDIQKGVEEALFAMVESVEEVNKGVELANQSGEALTSIEKAVSRSQTSGEKIAESARHMDKLASELVTTMQKVSAVVDDNSQAAKQMLASSSEVMSSVENIAAVSEENSASSEEVSASARELNNQARQVANSARTLAEVADVLENLIRQYRLPVRAQVYEDRQLKMPIAKKSSMRV